MKKMSFNFHIQKAMGDLSYAGGVLIEMGGWGLEVWVLICRVGTK